MGTSRIGIRCRMKRSLIRTLIITILSVLVVYGLWYTAGHRFYRVSDTFYRSSDMGRVALGTTLNTFDFDTVIDLRTHEECPEKQAMEKALCEEMGVEYINLPSAQEPGPETVKAFLDIMDTRQDDKVLIHCHHGRGRAVLFSALYRITYKGWSNEKARKACRLITKGSSFCSSNGKGEYILSYVPPKLPLKLKEAAIHTP